MAHDRRGMTWVLACTVACLAMPLTACDERDEPRPAMQRVAQVTDTRDVADAGDEDASVPDVDELDDAQIVTVIVTVNTAEISQGQLALERSEYSDVREYASRMVDDHGMANQTAAQVLDSLDADPTQSDLSRALSNQGARILTQLERLPSQAFDEVYITAQARQHRAVLLLLDHGLIDAADDAQVTAFLETTRDTVEDHLEHAREVQRDLAAQ